jgi:hypothetical protein
MSLSKLVLMSGLHFLAMYFLMYVMVDRIDNIHLNLNNAYMAAIMTAPMILLEVIIMKEMYQPQKLIPWMIAGSLALFTLAFTFIRQQTFITDQEFLRSMIPHHSGAVLMCEQATLTDPELVELCNQIIENQKEEIAIMEQKLSEID